MADDDDKKPEPKQTTPEGARIPIPKRRDVLDVLRKAAKPTPPDSEGQRGPKD